MLSAGASHAAPTCAPVARGRALIAPARAPRPGGVQDLRALRPAWHQQALPVPDSASASPSATRRCSRKFSFSLKSLWLQKTSFSGDGAEGRRDAHETPAGRGGASLPGRGSRVLVWSPAGGPSGTLQAGHTMGSRTGAGDTGQRSPWLRGARAASGRARPQFARGNGGLPSA